MCGAPLFASGMPSSSLPLNYGPIPRSPYKWLVADGCVGAVPVAAVRRNGQIVLSRAPWPRDVNLLVDHRTAAQGTDFIHSIVPLQVPAPHDDPLDSREVNHWSASGISAPSR